MPEDIFATLSKLELRELIGYSIESEKAAIEFYADLKSATKSNSLVSQVFDNVIRDETAHRDSLVRLHKELFGTPKYSYPKGLPPFESAHRLTTMATLVSALTVGMANESNAARVYMFMSKAHPEHARLFRQHAAMERIHYEALKAQRDLYEHELAELPSMSVKPIARALKDDI